jgi:TonB family protein
MQPFQSSRLVAGALTVGLHGLMLALVTEYLPTGQPGMKSPVTPVQLVFIAPPSDPPRSEKSLARPPPSAPTPLPAPTPPPAMRSEPATMAAPAAPTAEEWAFAAGYTLKNSKGYRHSWGKQVRSMMGTAVEGPDQGTVRFRVEIAPDGRLARLETLWTTSDIAERLARKAIEAMPPLPPTPTGQPLVFERTIVFSPFATDDTPVYRDDCEPDPPTFRNPFAWDGKATLVQAPPQPNATPDPREIEDCLKQLPRDTFEAESAHDQRQLERGRSSKFRP